MFFIILHEAYKVAKDKFYSFAGKLVMRFIIFNSKKNANLKIENSVFSGRVSENLSLGYSISDSSKGLLLRGKWGARIDGGFATKTR